jgi:hypothetical protein
LNLFARKKSALFLCFRNRKTAPFFSQTKNATKMKKIIIVLLAAAASFTAANKASAQEKGLWIGGKLGYWHDKT